MVDANAATFKNLPAQDPGMGAREAIGVLEVLRQQAALTTRYVRQHVLGALCAGPELMLDTPEYVAFEDSVYAALVSDSSDAGTLVSPEAAFYLEHVLGSAAGDGGGLVLTLDPYDGFSEQAYLEVRSLLGREGREYLAISEYERSLTPDLARVRSLVDDEWEHQPRTDERVGSDAMGYDDGFVPWMPHSGLAQPQVVGAEEPPVAAPTAYSPAGRLDAVGLWGDGGDEEHG